MKHKNKTITFSVVREHLIKILAIIMVLFVLINLGIHFSWFFWHQDFWSLNWRFDLGGDMSVPTWFASAMLFMCTVLLAICAEIADRRQTGFVRSWQGLAIIFLMMSIDEIATLHEWSGTLLESLPLTGFFYYQWVIFGLAFVAVFGLLYARFFFHLPRNSQRRFLLAAVLFVGGALGVEMFNARFEWLVGYSNLTYDLLTTVEETLEMLGVLVFIDGLLRYIENQLSTIQFHLGTPENA